MKRDVHLYALVRVKVVGIESESDEEAMETADELDLHALLDVSGADGAFLLNKGLVVDHAEYAEEVSSYLVDAPGGEGVAYDMHGERLGSHPATCTRCGR